ncbi:histidine phosphatase family protein [Dongia rigui]|uniref:Histidine phosphatase family protein n=1 Tax=Dongia rigui TaxID=940149 RepID=A0ABU5DXU4_9PROT|nr:histidine phosphatase family protein [Dongia rigui]MDY0871759.1 histidine phosphatase family protein [Dongia rigui]
MSVRCAIIRHAPTKWNVEKRLQGRTDIGLGPEGRIAAASWSVPADWQDWRVLTSPLTRARETAAILFPTATAEIEPALREMSFGDWEGQSLDALRGAPGSDAESREAMGLDFRAPNGESPREVQQRLLPLLSRLCGEGRDVVLVSHKAVQRALYALATGWQMTEKPPVKLKDGRAHLFHLGSDGRPDVVELNIDLGHHG